MNNGVMVAMPFACRSKQSELRQNGLLRANRLLRFSFVSFILRLFRQRFKGVAMPATLSAIIALPARHEVHAAAQGRRTLNAYLADGRETQHIQIVDARNQAHHIELPTTALRLLADVLTEMAEGNAVQVVPVHAELTTQEAADLLNVSRPHLVKLLEDGEIPFHRTGKHRRVRLADLMQYKEARMRASEATMAELTRLSQELGLGYE